MVRDLKYTGSYSERYMANRIQFSGICGNQDPTVRDAWRTEHYCEGSVAKV